MRRVNSRCRSSGSMILSPTRIPMSGNLQHKRVMAEMSYKVKSLKRSNGQPSSNQPQPAKKFQTFEDLDAYQVAREFRKAMYAVSRRLPGFEKFELASQ